VEAILNKRTYRNDLLIAARDRIGTNNSAIAREKGISRPTVIAVFKGESDSAFAIGAVADAVGVSLSEVFEEAA
jgi:DNA-binding XRE family transcriptional regulator